MSTNLEGYSCLLSSGAPNSPVHTGHCPVPDFLPKMARPTVADLGAVGAPDMSGAHRTVRCTPDSPVPPSDRWPGRPLAHRTVRCTPDSPVNFSRTPSANSRERRLQVEAAWRTVVSGAPPDSPVPQTETACWLYTASNLLFFFSLFLTLR